jgi:hypothetical protein
MGDGSTKTHTGVDTDLMGMVVWMVFARASVGRASQSHIYLLLFAYSKPLLGSPSMTECNDSVIQHVAPINCSLK